MAGLNQRQRLPKSTRLFAFDEPYLVQHGCIAGVDEVGRGPLAGPVVAAAVVLRSTWFHPSLNDSKQVSPSMRQKLFDEILCHATSVGTAVVSPEDVDRLNIRQASFVAMRQALLQLAQTPSYVLVDGFKIPNYRTPHDGIIGGDAKSAHIAAASIVAKVTRDALMEEMDAKYPAYGFARHKGYGTKEHLDALKRYGPSPIHRRSFAPVRLAESSSVVMSCE